MDLQMFTKGDVWLYQPELTKHEIQETKFDVARIGEMSRRPVLILATSGYKATIVIFTTENNRTRNYPTAILGTSSPISHAVVDYVQTVSCKYLIRRLGKMNDDVFNNIYNEFIRYISSGGLCTFGTADTDIMLVEEPIDAIEPKKVEEIEEVIEAPSAAIAVENKVENTESAISRYFDRERMKDGSYYYVVNNTDDAAILNALEEKKLKQMSLINRLTCIENGKDLQLLSREYRANYSKFLKVFNRCKSIGGYRHFTQFDKYMYLLTDIKTINKVIPRARYNTLKKRFIESIIADGKLGQ